MKHKIIDDRKMAQTIADAAPPDPASPPFDAVWARAIQQHMRSRRLYTGFASAAVLVAVFVVALDIGRQPSDDTHYIQAADFLDSTSWSAPSDALLPDHQFDLYQEFPGFIESTKPAEGALL